MLAEKISRIFFPELIFRIPTSEKKFFLTFDDGPTPAITPWVLDVLKKYDARATFFCIGEKVEKHPEIFSEIIRQGHTIGNHTMHHLNGWKAKTSSYIQDINLCNTVLNNAQCAMLNVQCSINYFRPPFGKLTPSQYFSLKKNYRIVMWDVLSKDYDSTISEERCLQRVISKSQTGSIVAFHDSLKAEKNLLYVLPKVLEYFSKRNYSFKKLEQ